MKTLLTSAAALALALAPLAVEAGPKGRGNGGGHGNGHGNGAWASGEFCPPGLADRDPACVPPGQARRDRGGDDHADEDDDHDDDEEDVDYADAIDAGDVLGEVIDAVETSGGDDDNDARRGLAIVGGLIGLALLEQAARDRAAAPAAVAPMALAPVAPTSLSFADVPSRPSWIEALALAGDAADPEPVFAPLLAPTPPPITARTTSPLIPPPPPLADDVTGALGGTLGGF